MANPVSVMRSIYSRFGLELRADAQARMQSFLTQNPQEKHGGHRYTFQETGLDEGELRDRSRRYQEYFDVPSETVR